MLPDRSGGHVLRRTALTTVAAVAAYVSVAAGGCAEGTPRTEQAFCEAAESNLANLRSDLDLRNEIYRSDPGDIGNFTNMVAGVIELQENVLRLYRELDEHAPAEIQPDTARAAELYADLVARSAEMETSVLGALAGLSESLLAAVRTTNATEAVDAYAEDVCGFNISARIVEP